MTMLIIGLGNIGNKYCSTRHNIGFDIVEAVARDLKIKFEKTNSLYLEAVKRTDDSEIVLIKPTTYMNLSGLAVDALLQNYNLDPDAILVVVDDFNLPLGKVRFRKFGSDGGHNGLASIIEQLGTDSFKRLRIGIGPIPDNIDTIDFVLSEFTKDETIEVEKIIENAAGAIIYAMKHDFDSAMNKYNNSDPA